MTIPRGAWKRQSVRGRTGPNEESCLELGSQLWAHYSRQTAGAIGPGFPVWLMDGTQSRFARSLVHLNRPHTTSAQQNLTYWSAGHHVYFIIVYLARNSRKSQWKRFVQLKEAAKQDFNFVTTEFRSISIIRTLTIIHNWKSSHSVIPSLHSPPHRIASHRTNADWLQCRDQKHTSDNWAICCRVTLTTLSSQRGISHSTFPFAWCVRWSRGEEICEPICVPDSAKVVHHERSSFFEWQLEQGTDFCCW